MQGDLANARSLYQQAISMPEASQQKLRALEAEMNLDQLALEEGQPSSTLESSIRRIVDNFRSGNDSSGNNAVNDQARSVALLARCLQSGGNLQEAKSTAAEALRIAVKAEPDVRLSVAITAAQVAFAADGAKAKTQALGALKRVIEEAGRLHFPGIALDAQLAMGQIEIHSGALDRGHARLQTVANEALRHHYLLIMRKARAAA